MIQFWFSMIQQMIKSIQRNASNLDEQQFHIV